MNPQFSIFAFLFITFILIHIPTSSCADDEQYVNCTQLLQCGNIPDIGYPFWGGNRPEYCGHPGFELTCQTDAPLLTINSTTYRVLAIQNTSRELTVVREELWNTTCPTDVQILHNATLDTTIFNYSASSQDLTLYYGCPAVLTQVLPNQFNCSNNISYYVTSNFTLPNSINGSATCATSVIVRVNQSAAAALASVTPSINISAALTGGFGLQWSANDTYCAKCVDSGGRCGYNSSTSSFACFCSDQPQEFTCGGSGTQTNVPLTIGLALAGAAIFGIGVGWCIFSWRQRKKRRLAAQSDQTKSGDSLIPSSSKAPTTVPSTNLSQSIPSYPSVSLKSSDLEKGSTYFGAHVFSYAELEEATDNFDHSRELGEGGFGTVYYGKLHDGREVAVKRMFENNFKRVEQFMNEVEILTHLRHNNLVKLHGCTSKRSRELLLVYEYISNGTVADHLHGKQSNSGSLSWPVRLSIAVETAEALAYLHASDIIHRDVKTNNILLDKDFHVKVADFGLSRLFPTDATHVSTAPQGTPGYVDPEYYQIYQLTSKSDVYSFGVVLIELISSKQAVDTNRHRHDINLANMAISRIQNHTLHELVDPSLEFETNSSVRRMTTLVAELAFRCLQHENQMRPSMEEALEALKRIQTEMLNGQNAEVVDILVDDVGVLESNLPPMSPESVVTDQRGSESTPHSSS